MNNWLNIGIEGLALLKRKESFSSTWYLCSAKKVTIGWGHVKEAGDNFNTVDAAKGEQLLKLDVKEAADAVKRWVTYELNQNQFDALTVLVFNIGVNAFRKSTLLKKLNFGKLQEAANQFDVWNKETVDGVKKVSRGLTIRRAEEKALFLKVDK
jgi:lysozyme